MNLLFILVELPLLETQAHLHRFLVNLKLSFQVPSIKKEKRMRSALLYVMLVRPSHILDKL